MLGSRRSSSEHPNALWVEQQARNFCMHLQDHGEEARYTIHDRDCKLTAKFDRSLEAEGSRPIRLRVRVPNLNAYAEAWLGSLKRECLNHFLVFGKRHLDYLIREYLAHYHRERRHQSLGNCTTVPSQPPPREMRDVRPSLSVFSVVTIGRPLSTFSQQPLPNCLPFSFLTTAKVRFHPALSRNLIDTISSSPIRCAKLYSMVKC